MTSKGPMYTVMLRGTDRRESFNAMSLSMRGCQTSARARENRSLADRLTGKNPEDRASIKPEISDDKAKMAINEWAANALPTVEHHLNRAKEIKDLIDHPNATASR